MGRKTRLEVIAELRQAMKTRVLSKKEVCRLERAEGAEKAKVAKADGSWLK